MKEKKERMKGVTYASHTCSLCSVVELRFARWVLLCSGANSFSSYSLRLLDGIDRKAVSAS
jgi:hypothetical protein